MRRIEEIESKTRKIDKNIDRLKKRKDQLEDERYKIGSDYWANGGPCPKCGCKDTPKAGGFAQVETVSCPNCDYEVARWN